MIEDGYIRWLLEYGGVRLWSELGPTRWARRPSEGHVEPLWSYLQQCLEARAAGCVGPPVRGGRV